MDHTREEEKAVLNLGNSAVTLEGKDARIVNKVAVTASVILALVYVVKSLRS